MQKTVEKNKLEEIGFYTLSDRRALNASVSSPLMRAEMILTDSCNFRCGYCRGLREDCRGTVPFTDALRTVALWIDQGLKNVRFSGGEPTLYKGLSELVSYCKENGVERVAISTNGSASISQYEKLAQKGVNDFSISLDGCCAQVGDEMAGVKGAWNTVVENIKEISKFSYTTVGMVFNEKNVLQCREAVLFADSLGVSDIRVIPSAQYNQALEILADLPQEILSRYPILRYRIGNLQRGKHVRGLQESDCHQCWLALDDMVVAGGKSGMKHFPCIIHLREGGEPIGSVKENVREEREKWIFTHDCLEDSICRENCLDVCVDYNNRAAETRGEIK
jgi:MoaA/NifB/PqqE/SkfB family radical SAM enzyme